MDRRISTAYEKIRARALAGSLTRRDFLGGALGVTVGALVAACTPTTSAPAPTSAPAAPATPRKPTGTLTVATAILGNPGYIPARQATAEQNIAFGTFVETLVERRQDRSLGP